MNYIKKVKIFIKKYCYAIVPIITIFLLTILYCKKIIVLPENENYFPTLIGVSGTLIGFMFTAMTIFFSLNRNTAYMQNFKIYGHHIIFSRLVTFGIVFLSMNIICWLFNFNKYIILISFILGLEESIMAAYYTYKLSLNSFK